MTKPNIAILVIADSFNSIQYIAALENNGYGVETIVEQWDRNLMLADGVEAFSEKFVTKLLNSPRGLNYKAIILDGPYEVLRSAIEKTGYKRVIVIGIPAPGPSLTTKEMAASLAELLNPPTSQLYNNK